jgi:3-oxoadipate enol-lactonase
MPVEQVNGARLHWERAGSGPRLLFCNGSGSTLADARPLLDQLAAGFEVLAWDYRGFGAGAPAVAAHTMADLAADALGLLELAGWPDCRILGVSFGGMVAQELAVTHPERVRRLVLACTSAGGGGGASYPLQRLVELPPPARAAAALKLADSRWDRPWLATHPGDRVLAQRLAGRLDPREDAGAAARRAQLAARAGHDVWDRLGAIACPTLVACGRYDGIAPLANGRAIAARIDGAELRSYEGGHMFMFQDPAAMPELLEFLRA